MEKFKNLLEARDIKVGDIYETLGGLRKGRQIEVVEVGDYKGRVDPRGIKFRESSGKITFIKANIIKNKWILISYMEK